MTPILSDDVATDLQHCDSPEAAYSRLVALYDEATGDIERAFADFANGEPKHGPDPVYPYLCADVSYDESLGSNTLAFGKVTSPGRYGATITEAKTAPDGAIVFANFVDFDTLFGHRRNLSGYASALEDFDKCLPDLHAVLKPGDLVILSADHGCDPTRAGTDHTREHIPVLAFGPGIEPGPIGIRQTFADIGQSVAHHLGLPPMPVGTSFL